MENTTDQQTNTTNQPDQTTNLLNQTEQQTDGNNTPSQLPPNQDNDYSESMAWDMTRGTYVYEDIVSGVSYFWDNESNQWIVDESLLDHSMSDDLDIQLPGANNNNVQQNANEQPADPNNPQPEKRKRKRKRAKPNLTLYATGLPPDASDEEMFEFFKKAGIIAKDPYTLQNRLKVYRNDEDDTAKGDAIVTYLKALSIENAFLVLDGAPLRPGKPNGGYPIKLVMSTYEHKKNSAEERRPRSAPPSKKLKRYNQEEAELGWEEKDQKHVIIKYMFDPNDSFKDEGFYEKLKEEIEEEFEKMGNVESIKIFERNPKGVVAVKYSTSMGAQKCIEIMDGRWFDGRRLSAEFYDGFSNYYVQESENEKAERDKKWAKWLEGNEEFDDKNRKKQ